MSFVTRFAHKEDTAKFLTQAATIFHATFILKVNSFLKKLKKMTSKIYCKCILILALFVWLRTSRLLLMLVHNVDEVNGL